MTVSANHFTLSEFGFDTRLSPIPLNHIRDINLFVTKMVKLHYIIRIFITTVSTRSSFF